MLQAAFVSSYDNNTKLMKEVKETEKKERNNIHNHGDTHYSYCDLFPFEFSLPTHTLYTIRILLYSKDLAVSL